MKSGVRAFVFAVVTKGKGTRIVPIGAFPTMPDGDIVRAIANLHPLAPLAGAYARNVTEARRVVLSRMKDGTTLRVGNPTMVHQGMATRPTFHLVDAFGKAVADSYVNLTSTKAMAQAVADATGYAVEVKPSAGGALHAAKAVRGLTRATPRKRNPADKWRSERFKRVDAKLSGLGFDAKVRATVADILKTSGYPVIAKDVLAGRDPALALSEARADANRRRRLVASKNLRNAALLVGRIEHTLIRKINPAGKRLRWTSKRLPQGGANYYAETPFGRYAVLQNDQGKLRVSFTWNGTPTPNKILAHVGPSHTVAAHVDLVKEGKAAAAAHYGRLAGERNPPAKRRRARSQPRRHVSRSR